MPSANQEGAYGILETVGMEWVWLVADSAASFP